MKTTNFEISKKLKEIGFDAEFNFHYKATDPFNLYDSGYDDYRDRNTPSYDLETLIDALPKKINDNLQLRVLFDEYNFIGYQNWDGFVPKLTIKQKENESLADTAGRLIIKLFEAGIINFKK